MQKKIIPMADVAPKELLDLLDFSISFDWQDDTLINVQLQMGTPFIACSGSERATTQSLKWLQNYFRGNPFPLPIKLYGTPFQQQVLLEMQKIAFGKTLSYSDIARKIGRERACRGVGQACGSNPIPLVLPCHRVISHQGTIGGFSNDIRIKKSLLELEQRVVG